MNLVYLKFLLLDMVKSGAVMLYGYIKFVLQFKLICCPIEGHKTFEDSFDGHCDPLAPLILPVNTEDTSIKKIYFWFFFN